METNLLATLKEKMHNGAVSFTYTKKNGEERNAVGTLNLSLISGLCGEENIPKGNSHASSVQPYFDLNSRGWRSFCVENLVSIGEELDVVVEREEGSSVVEVG